MPRREMREPPSPTPPSLTVHIDAPAAGEAVDVRDFQIRGWLAADEPVQEIVAIEARQGGCAIGATRALYPRPDVMHALGLAPETVAGFTLAATLPQPGAIELHLLAAGRPPRLLTTLDLSDRPRGSTPLGLLRGSLPPRPLGVEIGAHVNPVPGLTPFYTDYTVSFAATAGRVDLLADGTALPFPDASLDYLCSSHVIEHLANPLGGLMEWLRVLKPGGFLYLIAPDKRYTFDAGREVTPPRHLLSDYVRATSSTERVAGHIDEFTQQTDWRKLRPDCAPGDEATERAATRAFYLREVAAGRHVDIHFHTFTPDSLVSLLALAGLTGPQGAFDVLLQAERYPADRGDGIGLLLRRKAAAPPATVPPTYLLPHTRIDGLSLPLVCPATLQPLTLQQPGPGLDRALTAGGLRYPFQGAVPDLRPARPASVRRAWNSPLRRFALAAACAFR